VPLRTSAANDTIIDAGGHNAQFQTLRTYVIPCATCCIEANAFSLHSLILSVLVHLNVFIVRHRATQKEKTCSRFLKITQVSRQISPQKIKDEQDDAIHPTMNVENQFRHKLQVSPCCKAKVTIHVSRNTPNPSTTRT
jgi:hypothetical protein